MPGAELRTREREPPRVLRQPHRVRVARRRASRGSARRRPRRTSPTAPRRPASLTTGSDSPVSSDSSTSSPSAATDLAVDHDLVAGGDLEHVVEHDARRPRPRAPRRRARRVALGAVSTREPVERPLRPELLHDADRRVRDQHEAEQRVLDRARRRRIIDEHPAEERVEPREHVRADDLGDRPGRGRGTSFVRPRRRAPRPRRGQTLLGVQRHLASVASVVRCCRRRCLAAVAVVRSRPDQRSRRSLSARACATAPVRWTDGDPHRARSRRRLLGARRAVVVAAVPRGSSLLACRTSSCCSRICSATRACRAAPSSCVALGALYLVNPIDLLPEFLPVSGRSTTRSSRRSSCVTSSQAAGRRRLRALAGDAATLARPAPARRPDQPGERRPASAAHASSVGSASSSLDRAASSRRSIR